MVDLMRTGSTNPWDRYACANWCGNGKVMLRGAFCEQCEWEEAFYGLALAADREPDFQSRILRMVEEYVERERNH